MTVIAAPPGFYLRQANGDVRPVVAFQVFDEVDYALPIVCYPDQGEGAELIFPAPAGIRGVEPADKSKMSDLGVPITYGSHIFRKRSYFRVKDGVTDFLLTVPPKMPLPNDERATRIPRTAFFDLRRTLNVFESGSEDPVDDGTDLI